jgi:hypothetical protein
VRLLYIALATAVLLSVTAPIVRADGACVGLPEGTPCPDDEDPCTVDACLGGACSHVDVPSRVTCDPVVDAYRRTIGLGDLVDELAADLADATLPPTARVLVDDALASTTSDLVRASGALAGRLEIPPPGVGETVAQARARAAFGIARGTAPRVRAVLRVLAAPSVRSAVGLPVVDLARRVRFLYRSLNQLKRELRRLQRVSGVFAR